MQHSLQNSKSIYDRLRNVIPEIEWDIHAPYIEEINKLKADRNAIILAHNYMTPEIFHCVSDFVGDSLALAQKAASADAEVIVMCGVHFMAETAKLLSPEKKVLLPDLNAGCSLASSITGEDVRALKKLYPGVPVVTYVNTSADVKAETDVCCTSSNAVDVVESLNSDRVIFLPDRYLASYVEKQTDVEIIKWEGSCEVHERFTAKDLVNYRETFDDIEIIAHPECSPDVLEEADFVGSTSALIKYVRENKPKRVVMITECSMSDNVAVNFPEIEFVRPCNLCPHMKSITLPKILNSLKRTEFEIIIDPKIAEKARLSLVRMLEVGRGKKG